MRRNGPGRYLPKYREATSSTSASKFSFSSRKVRRATSNRDPCASACSAMWAASLAISG
ncbi:MAG: hypothetical protein EYC67_05840 [Betaproteobacteria bacterium]|nr:MAG: hypothetical protein EYC67_05840 [Betaproteobacteria bacterium]